MQAKLYSILIMLFASAACTAQPTSPNIFTLDECIAYAIKHQASYNKSVIDLSIAKKNKLIALSSWLPQITLNANYQHYLELPTSFLRVGGSLQAIKTGVANSSTPQLTVTQNLFSNDALLAAKTAALYQQVAKETEALSKVSLVVDVSTAYYNVLLAVDKMKIIQEDTLRLRKNYNDALYRYNGGIADKVDFKQASISLNNSVSQLYSATQNVNVAYSSLKSTMGVPLTDNITVKADTTALMQQVYTDTTIPPVMYKRPEYRLLLLTKNIQHETTQYYKTGFIPTLSAFYTYNNQFQNSNFSDLYKAAYPNSLAGLQLSVPIFSGQKRINNLQVAKLQEEKTDWDKTNLEIGIYSEFVSALGNYKSNLKLLNTNKENVRLAREVYEIVKLQYNEGIKKYIEVVLAESDLQTAELNYVNMLYQTIQSKIELDRTRGEIDTNKY